MAENEKVTEPLPEEAEAAAVNTETEPAKQESVVIRNLTLSVDGHSGNIRPGSKEAFIGVGEGRAVDIAIENPDSQIERTGTTKEGWLKADVTFPVDAQFKLMEQDSAKYGDNSYHDSGETISALDLAKIRGDTFPQHTKAEASVVREENPQSDRAVGSLGTEAEPAQESVPYVSESGKSDSMGMLCGVMVNKNSATWNKYERYRDGRENNTTDERLHSMEEDHEYLTVLESWLSETYANSNETSYIVQDRSGAMSRVSYENGNRAVLNDVSAQKRQIENQMDDYVTQKASEAPSRTAESEQKTEKAPEQKADSGYDYDKGTFKPQAADAKSEQRQNEGAGRQSSFDGYSAGYSAGFAAGRAGQSGRSERSGQQTIDPMAGNGRDMLASRYSGEDLHRREAGYDANQIKYDKENLKADRNFAKMGKKAESALQYQDRASNMASKVRKDAAKVRKLQRSGASYSKIKRAQAKMRRDEKRRERYYAKADRCGISADRAEKRYNKAISKRDAAYDSIYQALNAQDYSYTPYDRQQSVNSFVTGVGNGARAMGAGIGRNISSVMDNFADWLQPEDAHYEQYVDKQFNSKTADALENAEKSAAEHSFFAGKVEQDSLTSDLGKRILGSKAVSECAGTAQSLYADLPQNDSQPFCIVERDGSVKLGHAANRTVSKDDFDNAERLGSYAGNAFNAQYLADMQNGKSADEASADAARKYVSALESVRSMSQSVEGDGFSGFDKAGMSASVAMCAASLAGQASALQNSYEVFTEEDINQMDSVLKEIPGAPSLSDMIDGKAVEFPEYSPSAEEQAKEQSRKQEDFKKDTEVTVDDIVKKSEEGELFKGVDYGEAPNAELTGVCIIGSGATEVPGKAGQAAEEAVTALTVTNPEIYDAKTAEMYGMSKEETLTHNVDAAVETASISENPGEVTENDKFNLKQAGTLIAAAYNESYLADMSNPSMSEEDAARRVAERYTNAMDTLGRLSGYASEGLAGIGQSAKDAEAFNSGIVSCSSEIMHGAESLQAAYGVFTQEQMDEMSAAAKALPGANPDAQYFVGIPAQAAPDASATETKAAEKKPWTIPTAQPQAETEDDKKMQADLAHEEDTLEKESEKMVHEDMWESAKRQGADGYSAKAREATNASNTQHDAIMNAVEQQQDAAKQERISKSEDKHAARVAAAGAAFGAGVEAAASETEEEAPQVDEQYGS